MLAAGLVVPVTHVSPASSQYKRSFYSSGFTSGELAICCIFSFLFFLLIAWCFVALMLARNHRLPYAFLLPAIIFLLLCNTGGIASVVITRQLPYLDPLRHRAFVALDGIYYLSYNLATLFLFLTLIAVLWNRENAIYAATEGKAGRRNPAVTTVHVVLAVLVFVLGTAAPAVYIDADIKFNASDLTRGAQNDYYKQVEVYEKLNYAYSAFVILTGVDIAVSTVLLWSFSRAMRVTDKITNTMLYFVVPLYASLNLLTMIFTVLLSEKVIYNIDRRGAVLGRCALLLVLTFGIVATLLVMSGSNRANWVVQRIATPPDNENPAQQRRPQAHSGHGVYPSRHQTYVPGAPFHWQQTSYQQNHLQNAVPNLPEPQ